MGGGDEAPFGANRGPAPAFEAPRAPVLLDVGEDGLDALRPRETARLLIAIGWRRTQVAEALCERAGLGLTLRGAWELTVAAERELLAHDARERSQLDAAALRAEGHGQPELQRRANSRMPDTLANRATVLHAAEIAAERHRRHGLSVAELCAAVHAAFLLPAPTAAQLAEQAAH